MTKIVYEEPKFITLSEYAEGTIQAGPEQLERLDEITERLSSGEFHVPTNGTIPCKCIDGRCGGHGFMPNAAGGSETMMVADDLTSKLFVKNGDSSTNGMYSTLLNTLIAKGLPVGGHSAVELRGAPSGCGANDKLRDIYNYLSRNGAQLRALMTNVGYEMTDQDFDTLTHAATERTEFSDGSELLSELKKQGGAECVDVLRGHHAEVVAVLNTRAGTTLDRDKIEAEFGPNYEAFNVDVWSFEAAARAISPEDATDAEINQKVCAMVMYNLATAGVLCGPDMRVVVLS